MAIQASGTLLEGCVLSILLNTDAYGYSLTQRLKTDLGVSESTLYPVVRRLQTDECLTVYDMPHQGRNRRYYRITQRGIDKFNTVKNEWNHFKHSVDTLMSATPIINNQKEANLSSLVYNKTEGGV